MHDREQLDATATLVATTRRLMSAVATSDLPAAELRAVTERVAELAATLEASSRGHAIRENLDRAAIARVRAGQPWRVFEHNPQAMPLEVTVDGIRAEASFVPGPLAEGPPGLLHGGLSASLLDSLLSTLAQTQDRRVVTGRLTITFRRAVPIDTLVRLEGEIGRTEGRKTYAEGRLIADGEVAVGAEALFIEIPGEPD